MGQQSGRPVSWALGLQGFGLKGELHLLFEIELVCVLNHNKFFGITMLFEFIFLHFECNFELFLQVQVHLLCMIVQLHFVLCLSMSLRLQVVLCRQMGLQVHDRRAEGLPAHTA